MRRGTAVPPVPERAEPVLSGAKECPRSSGWDVPAQRFHSRRVNRLLD